MNHSHTDIQLNTLKSFRSLLRKLDSLQSNEFSTSYDYVKNPKTFVVNGANSLTMKFFYDYFMHDDDLELDVKYQILQDTINDFVALRLHSTAPSSLFSLNSNQIQHFTQLKKSLSSMSRNDPNYMFFKTVLQDTGEYFVDAQEYLNFALKQVVRTANQVCATLKTISNDNGQHLTQGNGTDNTQVSSPNMSERLLERRDNTTDNTSQGRTHEY